MCTRGPQNQNPRHQIIGIYLSVIDLEINTSFTVLWTANLTCFLMHHELFAAGIYHPIHCKLSRMEVAEGSIFTKKETEVFLFIQALVLIQKFQTFLLSP